MSGQENSLRARVFKRACRLFSFARNRAGRLLKAGMGGFVGVGDQILINGAGDVGLPMVGSVGEKDGSEKDDCQKRDHAEWPEGAAGGGLRGAGIAAGREREFERAFC